MPPGQMFQMSQSEEGDSQAYATQMHILVTPVIQMLQITTI